MLLTLKVEKRISEEFKTCFAEVGGDEISEDGPKTEDDHHLHPKPKPKITEDRRPKISYFCILRLQINRHKK